MSIQKPNTNEELVRKMMNYSNYGALAQAFIMEAIARYADECAAMTDEQCAFANSNSGVNMETWRAVGREVKAQMDAFYGRHSR